MERPVRTLCADLLAISARLGLSNCSVAGARKAVARVAPRRAPRPAATLGLSVSSIDVAPLTSIADRCRYEQLNLSPDAALAPNVEARSERLSALAHALQTPVPRAPAFERL